MRSFVITSSLFCALIIIVIINFNYVNQVHGNMYEMLDELSEHPGNDNSEVIQKLNSYLDDQITLLSISVSFRVIDELSNALDSLLVANEVEDEYQFKIYKELSKNAIDNLTRIERFSIKNIL